MEVDIQKNLVYLCESISHLTEILINLREKGIISKDESDQTTRLHLTPLAQNQLLLDLISKKDWKTVRHAFLEILRKTNNGHCADRIEGKSIKSTTPVSAPPPKRLNVSNPAHPKISKWWPDKKLMIKSLHERKHGDKLLVEELHERIWKDENRMVVLCESADAAKYSGMGGVGKTLTAKWYANNYESEYEHILWIDCGEGSLLESFKSLARDLEVKNKSEIVYVEELARKSFESLSELKCLWIYDNAENYKGKDGIINVLPKKQQNYKAENFFCLITSRSREWGVKNVGHGKISDLELDIFSEDESVAFLRGLLDEEIKCSDLELRELSRLLGNLPMAMELALASLNGKKMKVRKYMKKLRERDLRVLDATFDKYEETINKNIEIFIEEILEEDEGKLAIEILMIFGYIRPDDIPQQFILEIFNSQVDEAIELLVKYSLISIQKNYYSENNFVTIHRLLQQVIRHNGKENERETLRKILQCEGFIDYKLIPFTKYADEDLRKEFPKVKAGLLDQKKLKDLMWEKRFDECVQLAHFIHQELQTKTTKLNHAICLEKNGQLEECVQALEELRQQEITEKVEHGLYDTEMGLLELGTEVSKDLVGGHLLVAYSKTDNTGKIKKLLECRTQFLIINSSDNLIILIRLVNSILNNSYSLTNNNSFIYLKLSVETKKIYLSFCSLSLSSFDRLSPDELTLSEVSFFRDGEELEEVEANDFMDLAKIKRLAIICYKDKKNVSLELSGDISMEYLFLFDVRLINWNISNWNVMELHLGGIPFVEKTNMKVQEMTFNYSSLNVACLPPTVQKLTLRVGEVSLSGGVELPNFNFLTFEWMDNVDSLYHFSSSQLTHIHLHRSKGEMNDPMTEVHVDLLPQTLTHLKISNCIRSTRAVGRVRKLDKLILENFNFELLEQFLNHLQPNKLVIDNYKIVAEELKQLITKKVNKITVGRIKWDEEDFKNYSSQFDREAEYYFLEGGGCRAMDEEEFEESTKLF